MDRISDIKSKIEDTDRATQRVDDRTADIRDKVNNEMMPKLEELQGIVGASFDDLYDTSKTLDHISMYLSR